MSVEQTLRDIGTSIVTKGKIRKCNAMLKEMRKELAESQLLQNIENLKEQRATLQTKFTALQDSIVKHFPPDRQMVTIKNSLVKPFGLVDVTLERKVDINIKRDFISRFERKTPLQQVVKTFTKENERIVPVFKRRKNGSGSKKKQKVEEESSSDDDGDVHPVVQAALNRMAREMAQPEPEEDFEEE
jgi:hypothetical protein